MGLQATEIGRLLWDKNSVEEDLLFSTGGIPYPVMNVASLAAECGTDGDLASLWGSTRAEKLEMVVADNNHLGQLTRSDHHHGQTLTFQR